MTYEFNVRQADLLETLSEDDDGADAFFDINEQLERKLTLEEPEDDSQSSITSVSASKSCESLSSPDSHLSKTEPRIMEKREIAVLQEITGSVQNIRPLEGSKKRKSDIDNRSVKFISLAERVNDFPGHMRETLQLHTWKMRGRNAKTHLTIPQSPMLLCKSRTRPVDYPSAEEREQKELEEIESFKIKAQPINRRIFETPQLGSRVPKAPVVVEPFNLTEYKKKEVKAASPVFQFKARPAPKEILEHPTGIPEKKPQPVTCPHTPSFVTKSKNKFLSIENVNGNLVFKELSPSHLNVSIPKVHGKTLPCPFSFEERDKLIMKHKEEKIKKVFEEEKEARKFHAKPVPAFIKKQAKSDSRSPSRMNVSNDEDLKAFKAQPALVLLKEPFKPKLPEHLFTPPKKVSLNTELRAQSRKEFDQHLKQREEEIKAYLQLRKEEEDKREQEEVARLRREAVHKAQPIRSYKPVPERPKTVVTSPLTPNFTERLKK